MDQRRDPRFETKQPVLVTILGEHSRDQDTTLSALLVNLSGRGLSLTTDSNIPEGSAVRIDANDRILLGEVCHSQRSGTGSWVCGVNLEHSLHSVHDLAKLMEALMGQPPQAPEEATQETSIRKQRQK